MGGRSAGERREKAVRHRFWESGAEWGITEDGHYVILRCGDLEPGVPVRLRIPGLTHRKGILQALIPGWGPAPRPVVAWVLLDPPQPRRPLQVKPKPVGRFYRVEQLEVIRG